MNIAVITYDDDFKHSIVNNLAGNNVKSYIDSISMLKELENFNPEIIIYDASAGDFALDDLKFLISRNKVKDKKFVIAYSKLNPVKKENLDIDNLNVSLFSKEDQLQDLINYVKEESEKNTQENSVEQTYFSSPEDIEEFYSSTGENTAEFESIFSQELKNDENFKEDFVFEIPDLEEDFELEIPQLKENSKIIEESIIPEKKKEIRSANIINITIDVKEIKKSIVNIAVDKLVENLKNQPEIKELTSDISKDFVSKVESELENLKEEIRNEIKQNVIHKMEEEITSMFKQELKDYITQLTSDIVKEKLSQIFGK
jgi:ribosomal protein L29